MKRSETTNTFLDGLMMDMNPMVTPNNVVTNCLNGTLITYNGNENVLLNDMGNGRVETAFLPEGYVPMGICELGGIIYIVSYNPIRGTCQIGSFPSPERNITSDEIDNIANVTLQNLDFRWEGASDGAGVYYLKKDLLPELKFQPGDKFIVYSNNITANASKLNGLAPAKQNETVRLSLGTVTSDGKLITFDTNSLKKFKTNGSEFYHIKENTDGSSASSDLDEYRSLVSQPYNVFNSKVSGTLVLIAELVQFDSFTTEIKHHLSDSRKYQPTLITNFSGSYEYVPFGVRVKSTLIGPDGTAGTPITTDYKLSESVGTHHDNVEIDDFLLGHLNSLPSGYFDQDEREPYTLDYEIIPCMVWGLVKHLSVKGSIELDKIGTGYIGLTTWKYYNSPTKSSLTWGLESYEEEDKEIKGVTMTLTRLTSSSTAESALYEIGRKSSYHGTFYELIPFGEPYYKFSNKGVLHPNLLYLVKIQVEYGSKQGNDIEDPRIFYRWYYTSDIFNDYYGSVLDFKDLSLSFGTKLDFSYNTEVTKQLDEYTGFFFGQAESGDSIKDEQSLCAIRNVNAVKANCTAKVRLNDSYGMFDIETSNSALKVSSIQEDDYSLDVDSQIKYTNMEGTDMETILGNLISDTYSELSWPASASSKGTTKESEFYGNSAKHKNCLKINNPTVTLAYEPLDDLFTFDIDASLIGIAKAYSSLQTQQCTSRGKIIPLAYNNDTFADYDLEYNGYWKPKKLGTFGFKEDGGKKGKCYVGFLEGSTLTDYKFRESNDVNFDWTADSEILEAESKAGWNTKLIFVAHHCSDSSKPRLTWWSTDNKKVTSKNGLPSSGDCFSYDSRYVTNERNVVLVAMKSDVDNYYYPINCGKISSIGSSPSNYVSNNSSKWTPFYSDIAMLLNNIFRFTSEGTAMSYWVPNDVYYGDNYQYTINIKLNSEFTPSASKVNIVLDNGESVLLSSNIISKYDSNAVGKPGLQDNVEYTISNGVDNTLKLTITIKDNQSGISLRNKLLSAQQTNLGVILYGYDGKSILKFISDDMSFSTKKLYGIEYTASDYSVVEANALYPVKLKYGIVDNELTVQEDSGTLFSSKVKMSGLYTLDDDGLLLLRDPSKSEHTFKRDGAHDTGTVRGYCKRGLGPDYELWK